MTVSSPPFALSRTMSSIEVDEIDVVAAVAGHAVAAAAAVEDVGAVVADQDVGISGCRCRSR